MANTVRGPQGRRETTVTVPEFPGTTNRDYGKLFHISEWPAAVGERWAWRLFFAYTKKGTNTIPDNFAMLGMNILLVIGINNILRGGVDSVEIMPLLEELMQCVQAIRDPARPDIKTPFNDGDTQEIATRLWLRAEVLSIHVNFSVAGALSKICQTIMATPVPSADLPTP